MRLSTDQRTFARRLRRTQTDAERRLWYHLRGRRFLGLHFRRQHPIGPYFADFASLELRLVIEVDGGQHSSNQGRWHDAVRSDVLAAHGYRVIRFWDNDVLRDTSVVLAAIRAAIEAATHRSTQRRSTRGDGPVGSPTFGRYDTHRQ